MAAKDEFGYPLEIDADERYVPPIELPSSASPDDHVRHADAYAAYQERYRQAHRERRDNGGRS